jgi:hypothetical protein
MAQFGYGGENAGGGGSVVGPSGGALSVPAGDGGGAQDRPQFGTWGGIYGGGASAGNSGNFGSGAPGAVYVEWSQAINAL